MEYIKILIKCDGPDCAAQAETVTPRGVGASVEVGWLRMYDGKHYCPEHWPNGAAGVAGTPPEPKPVAPYKLMACPGAATCTTCNAMRWCAHYQPHHYIVKGCGTKCPETGAACIEMTRVEPPPTPQVSCDNAEDAAKVIGITVDELLAARQVPKPAPPRLSSSGLRVALRLPMVALAQLVEKHRNYRDLYFAVGQDGIEQDPEQPVVLLHGRWSAYSHDWNMDPIFHLQYNTVAERWRHHNGKFFYAYKSLLQELEEKK
jgi:hypothetical protein